MVLVENGRRIAEAIPGARLEVLDGVSHVVMTDAPDRFAELVADFCASIG